MEVHCGSVVLDSVLDVDDDCVAPAGFDQRTRELSVDNLGQFGEAIRTDDLLRDL